MKVNEIRELTTEEINTKLFEAKLIRSKTRTI